MMRHPRLGREVVANKGRNNSHALDLMRKKTLHAGFRRAIPAVNQSKVCQ